MHRRAVGFDRKAGHKTESDSSAASHPLRPCRRCVSSALRWKCRGGGSRRRRQRERRGGGAAAGLIREPTRLSPWLLATEGGKRYGT